MQKKGRKTSIGSWDKNNSNWSRPTRQNVKKNNVLVLKKSLLGKKIWIFFLFSFSQQRKIDNEGKGGLQALCVVQKCGLQRQYLLQELRYGKEKCKTWKALTFLKKLKEMPVGLFLSQILKNT